MWIKSQDKKSTINIVETTQYKSGKRYYIYGCMKSQNFFSSPRLLGKYKSEEEFNNEVKAIEECLIKSENFYAMK